MMQRYFGGCVPRPSICEPSPLVAALNITPIVLLGPLSVLLANWEPSWRFSGRSARLVLRFVSLLLLSCLSVVLVHLLGVAAGTDATLLKIARTAFPSALTHLAGLFAIGTARAHFARLRAGERALWQLQEDSFVAQLEALNAQLRPHYLFNTLNAVSSLLHADPTGASKVAATLTRLIRRVGATGTPHLVTLSHEVESAEMFLAVAKAKYGEGLRMIADIDSDAAELLVPRFILQPIVENAVQYGTTDDGLCTIGIRARVLRNGTTLQIEVANATSRAKHASRRGAGTRTGINNVRERLRAHYGERGSFELSQNADGDTVAALRLPISHAPRPGPHHDAGAPRAAHIAEHESPAYALAVIWRAYRFAIVALGCYWVLFGIHMALWHRSVYPEAGPLRVVSQGINAIAGWGGASGLAAAFGARTPLLRRALPRLVAATFVLACWPYAVERMIRSFAGTPVRPAILLFQVFPSLVLFVGIWMGVGVAIRVIVEDHGLTRKAGAVRARSREAELMAQRAQAPDSVISNVMEEVANLALRNAAAADALVIALADFLRHALLQLNRERVTIREELELVSAYLELYHKRCGKSLGLYTTVDDPACLDEPIPSGLVLRYFRAIVDRPQEEAAVPASAELNISLTPRGGVTIAAECFWENDSRFVPSHAELLKEVRNAYMDGPDARISVARNGAVVILVPGSEEWVASATVAK
jgi:LytS/YehU family sensor histidine kinase